MYTIDKDKVAIFLNSLSGKVYAPIELIDGTVSYGFIEDGKLSLKNTLPVLGPKSVLFPPMEPLLSFKANKPEVCHISDETIYLFGVRSCDLEGIKFLDKFFCQNFDYCDNHYYQKRKQTFIISLASSETIENTFKTPTHKSYIADDGFDLQFIELNEKYLVETGSSKGIELINNNRNFFNDATDKELEILPEIKTRAESNLPSTLPFEEAVSILMTNQDCEQFWEKLSNACIECGGCSYSCPGCSCFNIYDLVYSEENNLKNGFRCRSWDSCIYGGFTKEASGHNPRSKQHERFYRRYSHKLKADTINFGHTSCYGCGRCTSVCPVNLGMINVIHGLVNHLNG